MCKTKTRTDATDPPTSIHRRSPARSTTRHRPSSSSSSISTSTSLQFASESATGSSQLNSSTSASSHSSLASLRSSLPENPHIYSFTEISTATNNFLSRRIPSSSSAWRCSLRGKDVVVVQRKLRRRLDLDHLRPILHSICRSHHSSIIKLLGASVSTDHIYLVYDHIAGATLSACLRNPRTPHFTVLSSWLSRMQIATDLAEGLQYIHHYSGINLRLIHNRIKSSSIIVTEPSLNAKICHFGAAELTGELSSSSATAADLEIGEISTVEENQKERSNGRGLQVEGTRGYMPPELVTAGIISQKTDVYAYGVVVLEILSGEEPLRYRYDQTRGDYEKVSLTERAREAIASDDKGRVRRWVDRRLKDSFPVEVAEKMMRVALECVHVEPDKRPDMERVAGKVSRLYLKSKGWAEQMKLPTDFSVSMAPR